MKIDLQKYQEDIKGKWFAFDTKRFGVLRFKLKKFVDFSLSEMKELSDEQIQKLLKDHVLDWKGFEDKDGEPLPFDAELFSNDDFYNILDKTALKMEKFGLIFNLILISNDSSRFAEDDQASFL